MSGVYTEIVRIEGAPSSAAAGQTVNIDVLIKNTYSATTSIMVGGALEYGVTPWPTISFPSKQASVMAGYTHRFTGSFTMPSSDVTIHAYSYYYGADGLWHFDDELTKVVSLSEVSAGTISKMQLEYDSSRANIPAYNIPQNKSGLVHIWGRNDMSSAQRMGIHWFVHDPNYAIVEEHYEWEAWPYTGAGSEHEFIGGRFNLDKPGTYTINVWLLMNPDSPVYVDTYYGSLCNVVAELEPTFSNFGVTAFS